MITTVKSNDKTKSKRKANNITNILLGGQINEQENIFRKRT